MAIWYCASCARSKPRTLSILGALMPWIGALTRSMLQIAEHQDMFRAHSATLETHSQNFAQLAATLGAFSRELREIRRLLVDEHLARELREIRLRVDALEDRLPPEAQG
jgi:hypothetical protein